VFRLDLATSRRAQSALLLLAVAAATYVGNTLSPLEEAIGRGLSLNDNQVAVLQGPALAFPMVLTAVPWGALIDRASRARLIAAIGIAGVFASVLTGFGSTFDAVLVARCLAGWVSLSVVPVALSLVADVHPQEARGHATMLVNIAQSIGMAAAFALGGLLLHLFGKGPGSWRTAMFGLSMPLVPAALLTLRLREPPRAEMHSPARSSGARWQEIWSYRATLAPLLIGIVMGQIALWADFIWAAPMLARRFALTPGQTGMVMAAGLLGSGVLGSIGGGILADRCHRQGGAARTTRALSVLSVLSIPAALFALLSDPVAAGLVLGVFLTLTNMLAVIGTSLFIVVIPNELRGSCVALLVAVCVLVGNGLAPPMVSGLSSVLGGAQRIGMALSGICATASLVAAISFGGAARMLRKARRE
jgi:MFS family permease